MFKKPIIRIGFVAAIVVLLITISFLPLGSSIVKNNKNYSNTDNSFGSVTVCGYITNELTGIPIFNAQVALRWVSGNQTILNYTYTNPSGFYTINTEEGHISLEDVSAPDFFSSETLWYDVYENEVLWVNLSLYPIPPENSIICGYIMDNKTNESINGAKIELLWRNVQREHYLENFTYANTSGFYLLNIGAGEIRLRATADCYYLDYLGYFSVDENETLWVNISLYHIPPQNSTVFGYITDALTNETIEGVKVRLVWHDDNGTFVNDTLTDSSGFYSINSAPGTAWIKLLKNGYYIEYYGGYFNINISENETIEINGSMYLTQPKNSIVYGYILDAVTHEPVGEAKMYFLWRDYYGHYSGKSLTTSTFSFYCMFVAAGQVQLDYVEAEGYYDGETDWYNISANETLWLNASLQPPPPENSVVCGYISDSKTKEPIDDAKIYLYWEDEWGHYNNNMTYTNPSGYYYMNVAAGRIDIYIYAEDYWDGEVYYDFIGENVTLWLNFSFNRQKRIEIRKPFRGIYMNNQAIFPFFITIVIGSIDVKVRISEFSPDVELVEFYVDDILKATDSSPPFNWTWNEIMFFRHTLKAISYCDDEEVASDKVAVWKFF